MTQQLSFDLPVRTALGRNDFFVSPSNASAVAMIETWQSWPARKLMLLGPAGSGKTHLAHVWAALSGATIISASDLIENEVPTLAVKPIAVEDCDQIAGNAEKESTLFHLHNLALAEGSSLLLSGLSPPKHWELTLPDLASRLEGTPSITIAPPDDALLSAVIMKLFADRQLFPAPAVIPYLVTRIDRSFEAASIVVANLDTAALETRRSVTVPLAREVLDNTGA